MAGCRTVRWVGEGAAATSAFTLGMGIDSNIFLVLLLGLQEVAGCGYSLPFLFFSAHSLALTVALTATLLDTLHPCATFTLMAVFCRVWSNARVRVQDG